MIPHLYEHIIHYIRYRNLKFIKELGVEISNVHNIVSFGPKPWLKRHIDFNTEMGKQAMTDFEIDCSSYCQNPC